jgi:hypothetical protein
MFSLLPQHRPLLTIDQALRLLPLADATELLWLLLEYGRTRGRRHERAPLGLALAVARDELYYSDAVRQAEAHAGLTPESADRAIARALRVVGRYMSRPIHRRRTRYRLRARRAA